MTNMWNVYSVIKTKYFDLDNECMMSNGFKSFYKNDDVTKIGKRGQW